MKCIWPVLLALALTGVAAPKNAQVKNPWHETQLRLEAANDSQLVDSIGPGSKGTAVLRAQILLDRRLFSSGEIDAVYGPNFRAALRGFQAAYKLPAADVLTPDAWAVLNRDTAPTLTMYEISEGDVAGPFDPIPEDMMQKSK